MQIWFSFFSLQQNSQLLCPAKPWRSVSSGCWRWHLCLSQGELHGHRKGFFCSKKGVRYPPSGLPTGLGFSKEALWRSPSAALLDHQHPWAANPGAPQLPLKCPSLCHCHLTLTIKNQEHPVCHNIHIFTDYRNRELSVPSPPIYFSNNISGFYLAF